MNRKLIATTVAFFMLAIGCCASLNHINSRFEEQIKSGQLDLFCNISGYYKKISPQKFIGVHETNGHTKFIFTNGSASNCYTENRGEYVH